MTGTLGGGRFVAVLGPAPTRPRAEPTVDGGRVWLLPGRGLLVVRECRLPDGWRCGVIASRSRLAGPDRWHVDVDTGEWDDACAVMVVDGERDPDGVAMLWLLRVWQYWPGRRVYLLARLLADVFRQPGGLGLRLDPAAMQRLVAASRLRPDLLRRVLDRLVRDGFLTPASGGGVTLTVPPVGPGAPGVEVRSR